MKRIISVIGLGKLGLCTAACFAKAGFSVIGVDVRKEYLAAIEKGVTPFYEPGLEVLLAEARNNLCFADSLEEATRRASVSFIIVPTPSEPDGTFSNDHVLSVLKIVGPILAEKRSFHTVTVVSTVMPGSSENMFRPLLERLSGKRAGDGFGLAYNPEFIAIGSVIENFLKPDLVLIGQSDDRSGEILKEIYSKTCLNSPYMARTNLINAEITKLALNCYCTMKISFANNLAAVCDSIPEADATRICEILGRDSRIGQKYIKPGLGFGGPCFPRDNHAFVRFMETQSGFTGLQEAVVRINTEQPKRLAEKIAKAASEYGPRVALLGLAYKPNTYLTELSQSLEIANHLAVHYPELQLKAYDPLARESGPYEQTETLEDCVTEANVAVILTPWSAFRTSEWQTLLAKRSTVLDFWEGA